MQGVQRQQRLLLLRWRLMPARAPMLPWARRLMRQQLACKTLCACLEELAHCLLGCKPGSGLSGCTSNRGAASGMGPACTLQL